MRSTIPENTDPTEVARGGCRAARRAAIIAALVAPLIAAASLAQRAAPEAPADLVVVGARVLTVDAAMRTAEAVAIRDGKFVAVGADAEVRRLVGPTTRTIEARGRTVIPGILETHSHAIGVARKEATDPFEDITSIASLQEWIRRAASRKPEGEWIVTPRSYPTRIREHRFPTRAELDAAAPRHPVVFDAAYSHVLSSRALAGAGIRKDTPAPKVGEIVRDASGEPTGLLRNARGLLSRFLPAPKVDRAEVMRQLEKLHGIYNSIGITSMVERGAGVDDYGVYEELHKQGRLKVRTRMTLRLTGSNAEEAERYIKSLPVRPDSGDEWLAPGPLKITVDGGILIGTAYMREPYGKAAAALFNLADPTYRGSLSLPAETIKALIATGHRLGWQMCSHVTGDAGVDLVLDAVEAADQVRPIAPARYNLIHAYFPNAESIARAKKLGVYVDTQPAWFYRDADALLEALGPQRMQRFLGVAAWLHGGVPVVANTDHMFGTDPDRAMNPFNPFLTMYVMVTRKTESGRVIGPEQRIYREVALRTMTRTAAAMNFDEARKGSIEVGKLGDLVVLSDDFLKCPEDAIRKIRPDFTVIGGRVVYERRAEGSR